MPPPSDAAPVEGRAFAPDRATETPARLSRDGGRLVLRDAGGAALHEAALDEIRSDAPLGRLERRLELPDGTVFLTGDGAGLDALLGPPEGSRLHASERLHPRLALFAVAVLVAGAAIWRFGVPVLVSLAVWATPAALRGQMDTGTLIVMDQLADPTGLPPEREAEVRAIFADIVAAAPEPPPGAAYRLLLQDSTLGMNAFALPAGTIVLTDELVDAVGDDRDAIAAVLAHEVAHVEQSHGLHAVYRAAALYAVIGLLAGDTGPILEDVVLEGNLLLSLAGSRAAEAEADRIGIALMRDAGYDPNGMARLFEVFLEEAGPGGGGWLSTHPGVAERIDGARQLAR